MALRKKKILVIEDDAEMRSLLKDFIKEEEGYEADSVGDGSEAFRKLAKEHFDLILTDIKMPGLSGMDILPGLKKLKPQSLIIVITAFGSEEVYRRALERGADAYLEKPIHLEELRILMQKLVFPEANKIVE